MTKLKLGRLPDRTPVRITFVAPPDLAQALQAYAEAYRAAYGVAESVAELVPFMLAAFLDSDRGFAKARKAGAGEAARQPPRPRSEKPVSIPSAERSEP
ncbi:DUF2274 domain-containing protein [Inquilinus limosus]|uniref:DUF2274 domain-containing protein n=1 Tax=Inquilinus limosus TaxID=171674 RepID=UPI003F181CBC